MTASSPSVASASAPARTPSVLAILVVRAADPALRACLHALASQTYEAFGVLAVDDATDDDARELLERALGPSRVIRNDEPLGYARSFAAVLQQPAVAAADHVLLLHGDTVLDEDTVACLVEATTVQTEAPGIVGAKVVDLDHPRELRDVGRAVDRFGHAVSRCSRARSTKASSIGSWTCSPSTGAPCSSTAPSGSASGCTTNGSGPTTSTCAGAPASPGGRC